MHRQWIITLCTLLLPTLIGCTSLIVTPPPADTPLAEAVTTPGETVAVTATVEASPPATPTIAGALTPLATAVTVTEPATPTVAVTEPVTGPPVAIEESAPPTATTAVVLPTVTPGAPDAAPAVDTGLAFTDTANLTMLGVLQSVDDFQVLTTALERAGMTMTLANPGPYTLFAPTDEAFALVPPATLEAVLSDQALLTQLLRYHLVADQADAARLAELNSAQSIAGQPLTITVTITGERLVNDALIVRSDVMAVNGVIHVIDRILVPPTLALLVPPAPRVVDDPALAPALGQTLDELVATDTSGQTIVEILRSAEELSLAAVAVDSAGLTTALEEPGPFTIFVPTDAAFNQLPALETLLNDTVTLASTLQYHLVRDYVTAADLARLPTLLTVNGQQLQIIVLEDGQITVNGALVQHADIETANGVIHVIGNVLTPPMQ
ncbi:MAG: hypothetical protein DCC55_00880 [Chloroflexi bacterium]|nr:MAG: hypothetical protein DCC55_00880 [Chloroflexota bacterium]